MGLAPLNIDCPHCAVSTHVAGEHTIRCRCCEELWQVRLHSDSVGFQELRVEWFDGLEVRSKPVYHHLTNPAPEPAPKPQPQPREYKCLECGWHECSETDWFKCTQCGNWTHDDISARFEALKGIPPPQPRFYQGERRVAPGYSLKEARKKAVHRSELRWIGAAFVAVIVIARFVTAHDFGSFVGDVLTLGLGAAIGLTFFKPDKR